ncbi:oxidase [Actinosynnema sp. ALI-1.44]|uniref:flavin reductase family protein n=1 Tax=Actinosynnema sp. ALI-1.44 TaxID=1933779 RepID=UPI00097BF545|nr:flavin reductase family protein [Actinosynnema sp. ALI-1.44]ONI78132.1 oxidase [Actinosynnema sp. ALI-1.44]
MTNVPSDSVTGASLADYRSFMSRFPTGVSIVTAKDPSGRPWGMTCSSVCSVALEPPTLLVCLRVGSPTLAAILRQSTFAVNLLHEGAQPAAELFASGAADRFDRVRWAAGPGAGGPHLLDHAHAVAHCQVSGTCPVGDHTVVFGEVYQTSRQEGQRPLLYGMRSYAAWPVR